MPRTTRKPWVAKSDWLVQLSFFFFLYADLKSWFDPVCLDESVCRSLFLKSGSPLRAASQGLCHVIAKLTGRSLMIPRTFGVQVANISDAMVFVEREWYHDLDFPDIPQSQHRLWNRMSYDSFDSSSCWQVNTPHTQSEWVRRAEHQPLLHRSHGASCLLTIPAGCCSCRNNKCINEIRSPEVLFRRSWWSASSGRGSMATKQVGPPVTHHYFLLPEFTFCRCLNFNFLYIIT